MCLLVYSLPFALDSQLYLGQGLSLDSQLYLGQGLSLTCLLCVPRLQEKDQWGGGGILARAWHGAGI